MPASWMSATAWTSAIQNTNSLPSQWHVSSLSVQVHEGRTGVTRPRIQLHSLHYHFGLMSQATKRNGFGFAPTRSKDMTISERLSKPFSTSSSHGSNHFTTFAVIVPTEGVLQAHQRHFPALACSFHVVLGLCVLCFFAALPARPSASQPCHLSSPRALAGSSGLRFSTKVTLRPIVGLANCSLPMSTSASGT